MSVEDSKFREIRSFSQKLLSRLTNLPSAKKIAVAVSGGCDSVALLLILQNFCRINQIPLAVFHVDHQLRESASEDCKWVRKLAKDNGLEFLSRVVGNKDLSDLKKSGIEAWARDVRYKCFVEMAVESGADVIATGHTADDQLETLLMRVFAGSSLQGTAAIRSFSQIAIAGKSLNLWRPFLGIQRNELENYLELLGQTWLNDESNLSDDFLRNRVRHHLVPEVRGIFPKAAEKVSSFCSDLDEVQNFLVKQAGSYIKRNLHGNGLNLSEQDPVLIREIMRQWLIKLNLGLETTRALLNRLVDLWQKKERNRRVDHRGFRFVREKSRIAFFAVEPSCEDK
jgi:tRNA(Ile)-lysidine synthetase-like protein